MLGETFRGLRMPQIPSLSLLCFRMQERGNAVLHLRHCDAETLIERTSFLSALKPQSVEGVADEPRPRRQGEATSWSGVRS